MFSSILKAIGIAGLVLSIALSLAVALPSVLGVKPYVVLTGSMVPAIPVGSLVYTEDVLPDDIQEGEVITFFESQKAFNGSEGGSVVVTHRVVENDVEASALITKGDANDEADLFPIPYENVIGKVVFHLPFLGRVALMLDSISGKAALFAFIAGSLILCLVSNRISRAVRRSPRVDRSEG